ncbi:hypothetical protein KM043_013120 [Ampulex compressa]|nr:hypothetical protein KM043_013120 [Ampulex compressa]
MKFVGILVLVILAVFFDRVSSKPGWYLGPMNFNTKHKALQAPPKMTFERCLMERFNTAEKECSVYIR